MTPIDWYQAGFFVGLGIIGAFAVVTCVVWTIGFLLGALGLWDRFFSGR